ncbi:MAG: hypothetical protein ABI684_07215, partial [Nitrospirota bacterium]
TRLLRRSDGKPAQQVTPSAQTARTPQSAPVSLVKPASAGRSEHAGPSPLPRPSQATTPASIAPVTSGSSAVERAASPRGPSTNPSNVSAGEVKASTPVALSTGDNERVMITLNWEQVQEEVGNTSSRIAAFLERGRFVGVEGHVATIGFAKQEMAARGMIEKPDNMAVLTSICERLSGQTVRLRVIELTESDPSGPTMAQLRAAKEKEQRLILFDRARAHPVVKQALEIFGVELAEVRPVSIQKEVDE